MLLFSLVSFDIYVWAIGLVFIILFLLINKVNISKKALNESFILFFLLIIAALRFHFYLVDKVLPLYISAFWGNFAGLSLCILTWLCIRSIALSDKRKYLLDTVVPLLWIHVAAFYLQFFVFLASGKYIDFIEPVKGEESRYQSFLGSLNIGIGSIRPTGLTIEPSTYFYVVLALSSLLTLHKGFKKNKILLILTIISMYLSFSTAAIIIATLFILAILFTTKIQKRYYVYIFLGCTLLIVYGSTFTNILITSQQDKFDQTSGIRVNLLAAVANRDNETALLAYGPFAADKNITNDLVATEVKGARVASLNDSGVFVFLWLEFGYLGIAIFLLLCYWQYRHGRQRLIFFLIFTLSKANPFIPFFALYFAISILAFSSEKIILMQISKKVNSIALDK